MFDTTQLTLKCSKCFLVGASLRCLTAVAVCTNTKGKFDKHLAVKEQYGHYEVGCKMSQGTLIKLKPMCRKKWSEIYTRASFPLQELDDP